MLKYGSSLWILKKMQKEIRMDEGGDGKKKDHSRSVLFSVGPSTFFPIFLFSISSVLPLLCSSSGARPPLLSLFLFPSVCVLSLSAAGPHPHRQYGCFPVLSSPVNCNSATLSNGLRIDAVKNRPSAVSGTSQEEPRGL